MNWLLYLVVAILGIFTIRGYKKGLIMTTFSILSIIVTVILAALITPILGKAIRENDKVYDVVYQEVSKLGVWDNLDGSQTDEEQQKLIDNMLLPKSIKKELKSNNNLEVYRERALISFKEYVIDYITRIIINALVYIVAYILIRLIVAFVIKTFNVISNMPIVSQFNKAGGSLVGLAQGLLCVWVIFVLIPVITGTGIGEQAMLCVSDSFFLEILYDNNLLIKIITIFVK